MADITLYDLATLDAVYRRQKTLQQVFLPLYGRQINFDTPEIMFDKVFVDDRMLAPFVVPNVSGRPQRMIGYETNRFRPAYVKIKDVVDPTMHIERLPGEQPIVGSLSIGQRRDAVIAELIRRAKVKVDNRLEWLAARAVIDGQVTISGEDYPSVTVDFRRDASLTTILAGAAKWDQGTADPLNDIKQARIVANDLSGASIQKVIFGRNAWDLFNKRVDLKGLMSTIVRGSDTTVTLLSDGFNDSIEYMGRVAGINGAGAFDAYVCTTRYIDPEDGQVKFMLDQDTVVGIGDFGGTRCFGAIMDQFAGYRPLDVFFKNWLEQDPSVEYLLTQSSPLMVPKVPNATFSIKVK